MIQRWNEKLPVCAYCLKPGHTAWKCPKKAKDKGVYNGLKVSSSFGGQRKPMKRIGKQGRKYQDFRNTVAYPYLIARYGEKCADCGAKEVQLDVDHILKRGSHPELKYELTNLQLLCRPCHDRKDNLGG